MSHTIPRGFGGIIVQREPGTCPHCGEPVEMVTVAGVFVFACFPEVRDGEGFASVFHFCNDPEHRKRALRDLARNLPRGE